MAKMSDGMFGGFTGRLGNIVGVKRNGQYYLRSIAEHKRDPNTKAQQSVRNGFGLTSTLIRNLKPFLRVGYKTGSGSYFHKAMSVISKTAIAGEGADVFVDYPKLKVARGLLEPPVEAEAAFNEEGHLEFSWSDNSGEGNARTDDRAMLLVVDPDKTGCYYNTAGAPRSAGEDLLEFPAGYTNRNLHVYMAFISADEKLVSDSVYLPIEPEDVQE